MHFCENCKHRTNFHTSYRQPVPDTLWRCQAHDAKPEASDMMSIISYASRARYCIEVRDSSNDVLTCPKYETPDA